MSVNTQLLSLKSSMERVPPQAQVQAQKQQQQQHTQTASCVTTQTPPDTHKNTQTFSDAHKTTQTESPPPHAHAQAAHASEVKVCEASVESSERHTDGDDAGCASCKTLATTVKSLERSLVREIQANILREKMDRSEKVEMRAEMFELRCVVASAAVCLFVCARLIA